MYVRNIPNPILADMLATLEGPAPILVSSWQQKVNPANKTGKARLEWFKTRIRNIAHNNGVRQKDIWTKPCGCLMMDNHVEEYLDKASNLTKLRNEVDTHNQALRTKMYDSSVEFYKTDYYKEMRDLNKEIVKAGLFTDELQFLADLYSKKMRRSPHYRNQNVTINDIGAFAGQFDNWAADFKDWAITLQGIIDNALSQPARSALIQRIKDELDGRRLGVREHPDYSNNAAPDEDEYGNQDGSTSHAFILREKDEEGNTYLDVDYPDGYVSEKMRIQERQQKVWKRDHAAASAYTDET